MLRLGAYDEQAGRPSEALRVYQRALGLAPAHPGLLAALARGQA